MAPETIKVEINAESLAEFAKLSHNLESNPDTIEISLSLYLSSYAEDIHQFGQFCSGFLFSHAEFKQFADHSDNPEIKRAWNWGDDWRAEFAWPQNDPPESLVALNKFHQDYKRRFKAQETTMKENHHLETITNVLKTIKPRRIIINDSPGEFYENDYSLSDEAIERHASCKSRTLWAPAHKVQAMFTDMFKLFVEKEIYPESFTLDLKAAKDMDGLNFQGYDSMRQFLSKCVEIEFGTSNLQFNRWSNNPSYFGLYEPLARENLEPIMQISSNTCAAPQLKRLKLDLGDYTLGSGLQTSLRDWLPNGDWDLEELKLRFTPISIDELKKLEKYKESLHILDFKNVYLTDSSWLEALDFLRTLKLHSCTLRGLTGGGMGESHYNTPETLFIGWEDYVLCKHGRLPKL